MLHPFIYIAQTGQMGRGVFASENIEEGTVIEIAPVIVLSAEDRKLVDQTLLHDYIFEWDSNAKTCCMALGYVPIYNHSYKANCEYEMDHQDRKITVRTVRFVKAGEELFINYNGDWNDTKRVWFDEKV